MNARIFVAREPDVAQLPRLAGLLQRRLRAVFPEDAVGVLVTDDFMMLDQVDGVDAQALEGFVKLLGRGL